MRPGRGKHHVQGLVHFFPSAKPSFSAKLGLLQGFSAQPSLVKQLCQQEMAAERP